MMDDAALYVKKRLAHFFILLFYDKSGSTRSLWTSFTKNVQKTTSKSILVDIICRVAYLVVYAF